MIVSAPFTKPAPPMPETARPTINILELTEEKKITQMVGMVILTPVISL
jgi:hypothetical protein